MKKDKKLHVNVNSDTVIKLTTLVSNSLVFATNAFLLGANVKRQLHDRKSAHLASRLQMTAEVASAIAGVAKVLVNSVHSHENT